MTVAVAEELDVADVIARAAHVPPPIGAMEWCAKTMHISIEEAPSPALAGPWKGEIVPYLRHWLDLITARRIGYSAIGRYGPYAHLTDQIWLVCGSQLGKTRSYLYNGIGYIAANFPGPIGFVLPLQKDAKGIIDTRLKPVFNNNKELKRLFPVKPRLYRQLIGYDTWSLGNGSIIYFLNGSSSKSLKSKPITTLFWDEFEELPEDIEGQGDPFSLGMDRMKARLSSALSVGVTTPARIDGHGWRKLCAGSHERLLIRCPQCGADQELDWRRLRWPDTALPEAIKLHGLARWSCAYCPHQIDTVAKDRLVTEAADAGRWVPGHWEISGKYPMGHWEATATFDARHQLITIPAIESSIRTGHLNSLYSQFISLSAFAANGEAARLHGNRQEQVTHTNGWCAEPTVDVIEAPPDLTDLAKRCSIGYRCGQIPQGIGRVHLALICDQQGNQTETAWFPWIIRAFGAGGSWLIDCGEAKGWGELEAVESRKFPGLAIEFTVMDGSNGNMNVQIQRWASGNPDRRFIFLGRAHLDLPIKAYSKRDDKRRKSRFSGVQSFAWSVHAWKSTVRSRMDHAPSEPKWYLPDDPMPGYVNSLTSEQRVRVFANVGERTKRWVDEWHLRMYRDETGKVCERRDNHFWDCEGMAAALGSMLKWDLPPVKPPPRRTGVVGTTNKD